MTSWIIRIVGVLMMLTALALAVSRAPDRPVETLVARWAPPPSDFIEVKGHLPQTLEISVSAQQVQKAKSNPDRWRLAVASVPNEPDIDPTVRYLVEPFRDVTLHFAQSKVPLNVANLLNVAGDPC